MLGGFEVMNLGHMKTYMDHLGILWSWHKIISGLLVEVREMDRSGTWNMTQKPGNCQCPIKCQLLLSLKQHFAVARCNL